MALSSTPASPVATSSTATPLSSNASSINPTPACLGSASSGGGGSLLQGGALAPITTTAKTATTAPGFYMNFLNNLANQAQTAGANVQAPGAQSLQTQAFNQASQNAGNYQPQLSAAQTTANNVAGSCISKMAQNYMNPYVNCVVNQIGNLGQNNIAQNLAPQATAGIVGSGQFGSQRGAGALGQTIANAEQVITGQQACALKTGYQNALCAAYRQQQNQLNAGKLQGCLATAQSGLGIACSANLAKLGCQQYTIAQNQQLFPLQTLKAEGCAIRGFTVPTAISCIKTAPIPGAYANSPLSTIMGAGSTLAGMLGKCGLSSPAGKALLSGLGINIDGTSTNNNTTAPTANGLGTTVTNPTGGLTDANGNPLPSEVANGPSQNIGGLTDSSGNPISSSPSPGTYGNGCNCTVGP